MVAVPLEYTTLEITVTRGTPVTDQVLGSVAGAVQKVKVLKRERSGDKTIYTILVVHADAGAVALEYTYDEIAVTKGTDVTDVVLATVAGVVQDVDVDIIQRSDKIINYAVFVVHLNA